MNWIQCQKQDFDEVMRLYRRVTLHLEQHINYPKWNDSHPGSDAILEAIGNGELYACEENGDIIGVTVLSENPEGYYEAGEWKRELRRGEYLVIHTLAVDPDHSKKGIGGYMVDRCIELAQQRGYRAVRLDVVPDNLPAIRLYEKKGFTYAGEKDLRRNIAEIPVFGLYEYNIH